MEVRSNSQDLLRELLEKYGNKPLDFLVSNNFTRKSLIKFLDKKIYQYFMAENRYPKRVQEDKYYMVRSLICAMDKVIPQSRNAPAVRRALVNSFILNIFLKRDERIEEYKRKYHSSPPGFITISPTKACNLRCSGCYANSSEAEFNKLDWGTLERIVREKTELWGSHFTVISGGEPFLYRSEGKTIIDLARKYQDNYFLVYTNGTLIDRDLAREIAGVGNMTPAISVEGFERETDERRGKGVFGKILDAMKNLRDAGVPFGISVTATKNNAELVVSDEFIDFYFNKQGVAYCWIFQLMPIGRATVDLMVTPEQRKMMFERVQRLIRERNIFIADFWNCGSVANGCISAGIEGGYLYIEWNGNVTPCVFNPYSPVNIYDIYKNGGTLNDVLKEPFFEAIRKWQKEYGLERKPEEVGNWIIPCAIKDHYDNMIKLLKEYKPVPIDESAREALEDEEYERAMKEYGSAVKEVLDPVWKREYLDSCAGE